ncbi:MHO_4530 family protein [Mycoplasmopsis gallopavonis]|uniref:Uncharacterized protein n=1 Tax=Mycoplasmopsis gallopavonis TaxID=76629 RepID=A0A449AZU8_9BACT|nr:hypothetical protein [Mycoplasmopsis gallopavonis]RIV16405.1 hypothetical protein D1113_02475 [Mycoplasmopsis gallopavonis]VEU73069.1 Uncharacterised protein [Mycoplasmopsis gallopavonis]
MIVIIFSLLILFFILICVGFVIVSFYFNFRSSSGIILFKIDNNNKRVLRLNPKYRFLSTLFDAKKSKFDEFSYIPLDDFLEFIDSDDREILSEYFNSYQTKHLEIKFKVNKNYDKEFNLIEKIIMHFDKTILSDIPYRLTINPIQNNEYICSIKWAKHNDFKSPKAISNVANKGKFKLYEQNTILAFALKPYFYNNKIENSDLIDLLDIYQLNHSKTKIWIEDGILYFVTKKINLKHFKELENKILDFNKTNLSSKLFIAATILDHDLLKQANEKELLLYKIKYSLYNILNCKQANLIEDFVSLDNNIYNEPSYLLFVQNLVSYLQANISNHNLENQYFHLKRYETNRNSKLVIVRSKAIDITNYWNHFFQKIPYLNFKFELNQLNYIKQELDGKHKIAIENTLIKISQEVYLKENFETTSKAPVLLIYAYNNDFDFQKLKSRISKNLHKNIPTALYINQLSRPLYNILNNTELKAIVIGQEISKKLYDTEIFYDCINIVRLAHNNGIRIIYENPPRNLDQLIVQKAEVFIAYYLDENTEMEI